MFKFKLNIALAIGILVFNSCTDVDICSDSDHIHLTEIKVAYDWSETTTRPDSMTIMATRVVDSWKCGYRQAVANGSGRYLFNNPSTAENNVLKVKRGQYRFFAINYNENSKVYNFSGITQNIESPNSNLSGISITYKNVKPNTSGTCFEDYNKGLNFASDREEEVHLFASDIVTAESKTKNIEVAPKGVEYDLEINFNVNAENVAIEEVCGQISGLYSGYHLTLQEPIAGTVKKMLDIDGSGAGRYTAKAKAIGIVANKNRTAKTGNGIIQLSIKYNSGGESKVEHIGLNMYNTINRHGRNIQGKDINLSIDETLTIGSKGLINSNNTDILTDSWFKYTGK